MPGYCEKHKGFYMKKECEICAASQLDSPGDSTSKQVTPRESALSMIQPVLTQNKTASNVLKSPPVPTPLLEQKKEKVSETSSRPSPSFLLKGSGNGNATTTESLRTSTGVGVQAPVKDKETNKSSAVPKEQMDEFIEGLVKLQPPLGFPLFSVCDNNSFHTTGYLWGLYAVKSLVKHQLAQGPVAVVNFDSHSDAGTKSSRFVASDRWGGMLVSAIAKEGFPACYLSTFNHPKGTGNHFVAQGGQGTAPGKPSFSVEDFKDKEKMRLLFTEFWAKVADYFGEPIRYVFFTIDRDVLRNSFTQWGDGAINGPEELLAYMQCVLGPLGVMTSSSSTTTGSTEAALIGFDITGLPEAVSIIRAPTDGIQIPAMVWKSMADEIEAVRGFAGGLRVPERTQGLTNVIFFSGSVSYTATATFQSPLNKTDCWDFVSNISSQLKKVLLFGDWTYVLCRQKPPIYSHGWKPFSVYRPVQGLKPGSRTEVIEHLGVPQPVGGFACTASVSTPGLVQPKDVSVSDMENKQGDFVEYHPDIH